MNKAVSASIVAYKDKLPTITRAINSVLGSELEVRLLVVDNSPTSELSRVCSDPRITYIHNHRNLGFGRGHNQAIRRVINESTYHLVLNPDVMFERSTLGKLYDFMDDNPGAGLVMPKILNLDGTIQYQCKLLPTPFTMISRRFLPFLTSHVEKVNFQYEMKFASYHQTMEVPFLSGCFMFLRTEALKKVGLFDERMFMYVEDTDLSRRIGRHFKTMYYPEAQAIHHYARGSRKNLRLMFYNSQSAIVYFNKWGWFWDPERKQINQLILNRHSGKVKQAYRIDQVAV